MKIWAKFTVVSLVVISALAFSKIGPLHEQIQEGLKNFYSRPTEVKIHIVLNQPSYAPGDTAFFKAYLLRSADANPVNGKRILNIELANEDQRVVLNNRVLVNDGKAISQLVLPDTLKGGAYTLFGYVEQITETPTEPKIFQRSLLVTGSGKILSQKRSPVRIFPEGGNFVTGFANNLVVTGLNPGDSGRIVDANNSLRGTFKVTPSGFGRFKLTPEESGRYFLRYAGKSIPLPLPRHNGVGIAVDNNAEGYPVATLYAASDSLRALDELYLVLTLNGKVCKSIDVSFQNSSLLSVPLQSEACGSGTAQLTLFGANGQPLAERLIFIPPKPLHIDFHVAKEFKTRQPVQMSVSASGADGTPVAGDVVVSVYKEELFSNPVNAPGITTTVFFDSDVDVLDGISLGSLNPTYQEIDNYLITRKWKRFTWEEILDMERVDMRSTGPIYFKGRAYDAEKREVPDGSSITFWLTGHDMRYALTTKGNEFTFPLFMDFRDDYVLFAVESKGKLVRDAIVEMDDRSIAKQNGAVAVSGPGEDPYGKYASMRRSVLHSYDHYASKKEITPRVREDWDVEADFEVDISKYKAFTSVSEILGEVVPMVRNKKVDGRSEVRIFLKEPAKFAFDAPLYFIDGVLTDNTEYFLAMDPATISTIGVVHSAEELSRYGVLGRNGIVIVDTKFPDIEREIPRSKNRLLVKGVNEAIAFKSRRHQTSAESRVPDMRVCLYWNPQLVLGGSKPDQDISFYTGDDTGIYVVRLEGMTDDGRPFVAEKRFSVSF